MVKHVYSDSELEAARTAFALVVIAVGSKGKLARALGISKAAVAQWEVVPAGRVLAVEALSGIHHDLLLGHVFPEGPSG